jgi:hypothetical protein
MGTARELVAGSGSWLEQISQWSPGHVRQGWRYPAWSWRVSNFGSVAMLPCVPLVDVVAVSVAGAAAGVGAGTSFLSLVGGSSRLLLTLGAIFEGHWVVVRLIEALLFGLRYRAGGMDQLQGYLGAWSSTRRSWNQHDKGSAGTDKAEQQREQKKLEPEDDERAGPEDDIERAAGN